MWGRVGRRLFTITGLFVLFLAWALLAWRIDLSIALPGPVEVLIATATVVRDPHFLRSVVVTALRAVGALAASASVAVPLGMAAGRYRALYLFLQPTVITVRSIPFISIILLAVIWLESGVVPLFVAVLMVFPLLYEAAVTGTSLVDSRLEEMCRVHGYSRVMRILHLWVPGAAPSIWGGLRSAGGIAWKVVVAAEVIGVPERGIGSAMGDARLFFETELVLAWTVVLIAAAGLADIVMRCLETVAPMQRRPVRVDDGRDVYGSSPGSTYRSDATNPNAVSLERVRAGWPGVPLFEELDLTIYRGNITAIMGPSGAGKTTLLRLLAGLHAPDEGRYTPSVEGRVGFVFQEPRLLPWRTVRDNATLTAPSRSVARRWLQRVGLWDVRERLPDTLSGGMRQRLALARSLAREPHFLLIDEPLTGVDPSQRRDLAAVIVEAIRLAGVTTVMASHDIDLVSAVADRIIVLGTSFPHIALDVNRPDEGWSRRERLEILRCIQSEHSNGT